MLSIRDNDMEGLTQQEEEVIICLWEVGPSSAREIMNEVPESKSLYTSITSIVRNLEKKRFLSPFRLRNSVQYHMLVREGDYKRSSMNRVVSNYFTSLYKEVVSFSICDRRVSKKEFEDLTNIIEDEES